MDANLCFATFKDCIFQNIIFAYCNMSTVPFRGCYLSRCEFLYTNLRSVTFENTNLNDSKFSNCCLDNSDFDSYCDTKEIKFHNCDLTRVDMLEPVYSIGPIGSRLCYTTFFAERNIVQCGCWNSWKGGTLEDFKERVEKVYPLDEEFMTQEDLICREQYLAAIEFFERMKKLHGKK